MNEAELLSLQSPGGAFLATVRVGAHDGAPVFIDKNVFVTALVLRALRAAEAKSPLSPAVVEARRKALGFLTRAVYPTLPACFAFYPFRAHPFWIRQALYADADDTAVAGLELFLAGVWPRERLDRAIDTLQKHRAAPGDVLFPFHCPGSFLTWFSTAPGFRNTIDLCVNTNVVAFLAACGARDVAGFHDAVETILTGVAWAGDDPKRLRSLTPWYPRHRELLNAMKHAVAAGVVELKEAAQSLASILEADDDVVCADLEGAIVWSAPVLRHARS